MNHLTMQQFEDCGFKVKKSYTHDEWITQIREKGNICIETTWKQTGEFESQEMYIANTNVNFGVDELKTLDKILNNENS